MKLFGQTGLLTRKEVQTVDGKATYDTAFYETVKKKDGSFTQKRLTSKEVSALQKEGTIPTSDDILDGEIAKEAAKGINAAHEAALDVAGAQDAVHQAMKLLDGGIMTGTRAKNRMALLALGELTNINEAGVDKLIARTQTYQAVVGQLVGQIIKLFGAGTGLSDADRIYAEQMAGGDIELQEDALAAILQYHDFRLSKRADVWKKGFVPILKGNAKIRFYVPEVEDYKFEYPVLPEMLRTYKQKAKETHQKKYPELEQ